MWIIPYVFTVVDYSSTAPNQYMASCVLIFDWCCTVPHWLMGFVVCVCVCVCVSVCGWFSLSVMPDSLWSHGLLCSWNCPGKNTGVGSHSLLHSTFLTHGSNPDLPHRRLTLYYLSHQGSPKNTGVGIHSLLQGSSRHRDWTQVSCVAGTFFTIWANGI